MGGQRGAGSQATCPGESGSRGPCPTPATSYLGSAAGSFQSVGTLVMGEDKYRYGVDWCRTSRYASSDLARGGRSGNRILVGCLIQGTLRVNPRSNGDHGC